MLALVLAEECWHCYWLKNVGTGIG